MARQEIEDGETAANALNGLIRQCLGRDDGWKAFYAEKMGKVTPAGANENLLRLYAAELEAERAYSSGDAGCNRVRSRQAFRFLLVRHTRTSPVDLDELLP